MRKKTDRLAYRHWFAYGAIISLAFWLLPTSRSYPIDVIVAASFLAALVLLPAGAFVTATRSKKPWPRYHGFTTGYLVGFLAAVVLYLMA